MLTATVALCAAQAVSFEKRVLSAEFRSEGACAADFDRDGEFDVVSGGLLYPGPDHDEPVRIGASEVVDPHGYSDHFFAWPHDVDGDGWLDVVEVGFPGRQARWYENPGDAVAPWGSHAIAGDVGNEAPLFGDLTRDGAPELVYQAGDRIVWAAPDAANVRRPWVVRAIAPARDAFPFVHGLGLGDLDADGRADLLARGGFWRQPASLDGDPEWEFRELPFSAGRRGGAQMLVTDVDGDGDADVVTSLDGHGWGLSWFERTGGAGGALEFAEHRVMDEEPGEFGVAFSQLHALALADVDGDGIDDVITGKRWWAHGPTGDPQPGAPAVLYWFGVERGRSGGARLVPHLIDDDSGVGTQVFAADLDGNDRADVVIASKKGTFLFLQRPEIALARREPREAGVLPVGADGAPLNLDFEAGTLEDWTLEGEAFAGQPVRGDAPWARGRGQHSGHAGEFWIGGFERVEDGPRGSLRSASFEVTRPWASFLAGGGASADTCVEIRRAGDDKLVYRASGADHETLQPVKVDLSTFRGEEVYLRISDDHSGAWGHVNFDDFRLHELEPELVMQTGAPPPRDPVLNAGLSPADAAAAMAVPPGFRVDLVAAEPELHQPIALAFDDLGRLWVAEAHSYPIRRPEGEGTDRILILEDADHDGAFESKRVFLEGLNLVSGLEVGFGGVWIGAAPYLLFVPDADRNGVPDSEPEVLLDGWEYQDTHETLNAFNWGPDGWLYGCHGVFTHSRVGKPGTPDAEREPIDAGVWRYHPLRREFEVFAWGTSNPWGVDFDARGQAFVTACVIPHLYHLAQGGRYERQAGSHFGAHVYGDIKTIADHRHWVGEVPHEGNLVSDSAGGGHAHCGLMIYLADQFPAEYRGGLYFANVHGNRINSDVLERDGSGYVGRHAADFLRANDAWFRGISLKCGPDGSVYLIDWYDRQACHLTDPEIWDRTNGRLYRVSYGEPAPAPVDVAAYRGDQLLELQRHPSDWWARRARRVLQERGPDPALYAAARAMVHAPDLPPHQRLRYLWCMHALGGIQVADAVALLDHADEDVRAWSIQLALEGRSAESLLVRRLERAAEEDPSPVVRLYLASGLQRLPVEDRWGIAAGLLARAEDEEDPNLPRMIWWGIEPLVEADVVRAVRLARSAELPSVARKVARRAMHAPGGPELFFREWEREPLPLERTPFLDGVLDALAGARDLELPAAWPALRAKLLLHGGGEEAQDKVWSIAMAFGDETAGEELSRRVLDGSLSSERREEALSRLMAGPRAADHAPLLLALLDDVALRSASIAHLAAFDLPGTSEALLSRCAGFAVEERRAAVETLAARAHTALAALRAIEQGRLARADLSAATARQMRSLGDQEVSALLERVFGLVNESEEARAAELEDWLARLTPEALAVADLPNGRAVFARTCQTCHALFGRGDDVGPDLTGSNRTDLRYLLENMVDPNSIIPIDYRSTEVFLKDGRVVTGLLREETPSAVRLETENDEPVVARSEIDEMRLSVVSVMPSGQLATLSFEEVRDLVAYMQHDSQVPRRARPGDESMIFDGETLDGWWGSDLWRVEGGEIVARAPDGIALNEFLKSELLLADFRLTLEVKLVPDGANAGIQLRSRPLEDGEVSGVQADAGAGWWGGLYEEHGRGLLSPAAETSVRRGEWNQYVIEAIGARVRTSINGVPCADLDDPAGAREGILALQLHSGGPREVRFRALSLEILDAD